ncbi:hypothetical protein GW17_00004180 [Ensete ventricosum]|nr:hypothetical protein GW17_00004180 [Ensete ventricosum]RZR95175.1 hypothetical protein BHM03_00023984 [Ensete ventricosum]
MAEFAQGLDCLVPSFFSMDADPSLELMSQLAELNDSAMENPSMGLMGYSSDHHFSLLPFTDDLFSFLPIPEPEQRSGDRKRKTMEAPHTSSGSHSELFSEAGSAEAKTKKKKNVCTVALFLYSVVETRKVLKVMSSVSGRQKQFKAGGEAKGGGSCEGRKRPGH